jgi:hypothetical protein
VNITESEDIKFYSKDKLQYFTVENVIKDVIDEYSSIAKITGTRCDPVHHRIAKY